MNKEQENILRDLGVDERDFWQIGEAIKKTVYTLITETEWDYKEKQIGKRKVIELIGLRAFLSCISRSAFHWTTCTTSKAGEIHFDSSKLFREG